MKFNKIIMLCVCMLCLISFTSAFTNQTGLISYYKFQETSGDVIDQRGLNNGTVSNATRGVSGKINNSFYYDGVNDYVTIPFNDSFDTNGKTEFSAFAWFKADDVSGIREIARNIFASSYDGIQLGINNGNPYVEYRTGATTNNRYFLSDPNITFVTGQWYLFGFVYNNTNISYYVDDKYISSNTTVDSSGGNDRNNSLYFAIDQGLTGDFNGRIDELYLYNRSLTPEEIRSYYYEVGNIYALNITPENNYVVYETDGQVINLYVNFTTNGTILDYVNFTTNNSGSNVTTQTSLSSSNITSYLFSDSIYVGDILRNTAWNVVAYDNQSNFVEVNRDIIVEAILFSICNLTNTQPYINFSFKNETTSQEDVLATIVSSWSYWLGNGTVKKSYSFSNSSENANYTFCFYPGNQTLNTNLTINYNNGYSQQRTYTSSPILTNSTTQTTLYLLPSVLGLYTQFVTRDIANNPLSAVTGTITRTLGSTIVTVASAVTDSSGLVIFFLNPDITYTAVFSKVGLNTETFNFVPSSDIRYVTMGTGEIVNGSNISIGTNYTITPVNSTLANNTNYTFSFNVSGNSDITFISMNITDENGNQLIYLNNSGTGYISQIFNTSNYSRLVGRFTIETNGEVLTVTKLWVIGNIFIGDYSFFRQGSLFMNYDFNDFFRMMIVLVVLMGIMLFMTSNEIADNSESKVAVIILLVWLFSVVGWLDNPIVASEQGIALYARQYGIAILSTVGGVVFFLRRIV